MDKRDRALLFRQRLGEAMAERRLSQATLARLTGADRSTISQLLAPGTRLPGAQLAADCAAALGVSADWLLGLSARPDLPEAMLATSLGLTEAPRALIDETIFGWHREAAGYKIRHVPATLPDMLKTRAMLEWEYAAPLGRDAAQAIRASEDRLVWMRGAGSDYEIALPLHEMAAFAEGSGYYADLPESVRTDQLDRLITLTAELYPGLRLFLFDAHRLYSAPLTIFGPRHAVVYLGHHYLSLRDPPRIEALTRHFDTLVRQASVDARGIPDHLRALRSRIGAQGASKTSRDRS